MKIINEINIDYLPWKNKDLFEISLKKLVNNTTKETVKYLKFDCQEITISILLSDNKTLQTLNKEHLGKNYPTNILSFPYIDKESLVNCQDQEIYLGDLALSFDKMQFEANEMKISLNDHFTHLLIHGILHLFGYDHEEDEEEAEIMENLEVQILKVFGIASPYV